MAEVKQKPKEAPSEALAWREELTERERKEIEFAHLYIHNFAHGTVGHNDLILIAKLAAILDANDITIVPKGLAGIGKKPENERDPEQESDE